VVFAGAEPLGTGHGKTKQEAEQEAARAALQKLGDSQVVSAVPKAGRTPRPRKRRPSGPRSASTAPDEGSTAVAEIVPLMPDPEFQPAPESSTPASEPETPPQEPARSRQFGEPIE
jgi:hypothetical protein